MSRQAAELARHHDEQARIHDERDHAVARLARAENQLQAVRDLARGRVTGGDAGARDVETLEAQVAHLTAIANRARARIHAADAALGRAAAVHQSSVSNGERPAGGYGCTNCGWLTTRWAGRCGACQAWGTVEETAAAPPAQAGPRAPAVSIPAAQQAKKAHVPEPPADAAGYDLKPDPLAARTAAELVVALRVYRIWAGEPSFRDMASQARQAVAFSTMCTALKSDELPPLKVVVAIVAGCNGSTEDQQRFATAWRLIKGLDIPGDRPTLRVVPPTAAEI
jgi:rubredoxin